MKYPCNLIQDLLPLYYDGVCSEESREIVEAHLSECPSCKAYLAAIQDADKTISLPNTEEQEKKKAASFQSVRKRLRRKQLLIAVACVAVLLLGTLTCVSILKNSTKTVIYNNNISVSMVDGSLVSRLSGSVWNRCKSVTVTTQEDGQIQTYLFFYLTDNKWDDLITSPNSFSEYTLCPADKGANSIDYVFYYTGDYEGIEMMGSDELTAIIDSSVLLWNK